MIFSYQSVSQRCQGAIIARSSQSDTGEDGGQRGNLFSISVKGRRVDTKATQRLVMNRKMSHKDRIKVIGFSFVWFSKGEVLFLSGNIAI
jgi:hypothetical protein